jgi:hypothetical protein
MNSMTSLLVLMLQEIIIGIVLGATARVTLSALSVAGSVIAQQLGLGFVTSVDPTQGQQGLLIGNFLTILGITLLFATDSHHLVISALNESYRIFSPGETMLTGDIADLATRAFAAAFKIGMQLSAPFLVRPRLQHRAWRTGPADAADAGLFRRRAALDHGRLPDLRPRPHGDDGNLPRLLRRRHARADTAEIEHDPEK